MSGLSIQYKTSIICRQIRTYPRIDLRTHPLIEPHSTRQKKSHKERAADQSPNRRVACIWLEMSKKQQPRSRHVMEGLEFLMAFFFSLGGLESRKQPRTVRMVHNFIRHCDQAFGSLDNVIRLTKLWSLQNATEHEFSWRENTAIYQNLICMIQTECKTSFFTTSNKRLTHIG